MKLSIKWIGLSVILVIVGLVLFGTKTAKAPTPVTTPIPILDQSPDPTWQKHINSQANYEVSYPTGWRSVKFETGEGFGPKEVGEDILWSISIYEKANTTLTQITARDGAQFANRKQTNQSIMVNNLPAQKFVTTLDPADSWYLESIVFETKTSYIVLSNGAMTDEAIQKIKGVPPATTFEKFYSSFHFVQ